MVEHTIHPAYLLTGQPRVGKSTMIKRIIAQIGVTRCGGFYTEEVQKYGTRKGFRLVTLDGRTGIFAHEDICRSIHIGRYGIDLQCLETLGLSAISDALRARKLVVIDEIGPMEAYCEPFRTMVLNVLNSTVPLIGTIAVKPHPWLDALKQHERVRLSILTGNNQEEVFYTVIDLVRSALPDQK